MSKLQDIQQILKEYADNFEQVDKKELLQVLTELCNYCIILEKESINLLQNRNSTINYNTQTPFSWNTLRKEDSPFKASTYTT